MKEGVDRFRHLLRVMETKATLGLRKVLVLNNYLDTFTGFSLRIEVGGGYYKITGESSHSEKNLTSSFYRLMEFSQKIPCSSRRILQSPMLNEHPAFTVHGHNKFVLHYFAGNYFLFGLGYLLFKLISPSFLS